MKNRSKKLVMKGIIGSSLLFSMGGVFAHTIIGQSLHEHVPLSLTSTIILGILLIFTGLFILPRMQGRHIRMFATTTFVAGVIAAGVGGKLISDVRAMPTTTQCTIAPNLELTDCDMSAINDNLIITNDGNSAIKVIFSDSYHAEDSEETMFENKNLEIVKLVKGSIKRSVVMEGEEVLPCASIPYSSNSFVIEAYESCEFNHFSIHYFNMDGEGGSPLR